MPPDAVAPEVAEPVTPVARMATGFVHALRWAGLEVPVVVAVVGTAGDPQDRDRQVRALAGAGAEVHLSNAGAARRALHLAGGPS